MGVTDGDMVQVHRALEQADNFTRAADYGLEYGRLFKEQSEMPDKAAARKMAAYSYKSCDRIGIDARELIKKN